MSTLKWTAIWNTDTYRKCNTFAYKILADKYAKSLLELKGSLIENANNWNHCVENSDFYGWNIKQQYLKNRHETEVMAEFKMNKSWGFSASCLHVIDKNPRFSQKLVWKVTGNNRQLTQFAVFWGSESPVYSFKTVVHFIREYNYETYKYQCFIYRLSLNICIPLVPLESPLVHHQNNRFWPMVVVK